MMDIKKVEIPERFKPIGSTGEGIHKYISISMNNSKPGVIIFHEDRYTRTNALLESLSKQEVLPFGIFIVTDTIEGFANAYNDHESRIMCILFDHDMTKSNELGTKGYKNLHEGDLVYSNNGVVAAAWLKGRGYDSEKIPTLVHSTNGGGSRRIINLLPGAVRYPFSSSLEQITERLVSLK